MVQMGGGYNKLRRRKVENERVSVEYRTVRSFRQKAKGPSELGGEAVREPTVIRLSVR